MKIIQKINTNYSNFKGKPKLFFSFNLFIYLFILSTTFVSSTCLEHLLHIKHS